jgi:hypothetical protein
MVRERQPAKRMRSVSPPPWASHRWAKVWRSWTDPQVPVEGTAVLRPTAARARDGLAKHQQDVQVEVEVGHPGTQQLGAAGSHVDQQRDQRQALQRIESGR